MQSSLYYNRKVQKQKRIPESGKVEAFFPEFSGKKESFFLIWQNGTVFFTVKNSTFPDSGKQKPSFPKFWESNLLSQKHSNSVPSSSSSSLFLFYEQQTLELCQSNTPVQADPHLNSEMILKKAMIEERAHHQTVIRESQLQYFEFHTKK